MNTVRLNSKYYYNEYLDNSGGKRKKGQKESGRRDGLQ
jgi:hypothetical protein